MLRTRRIEEKIVALYAEEEMRCPTHICIGQEAPAAAVSAHLTHRDLAFSAHRSHGHYICKGGDVTALFAELYGKVAGCALGKGGSQHLIDLDVGFMGSAPILASTISVGVGAAWGSVMQGAPRVVAIWFGDAATEEGAFHEAMNFAGLKKLPVVFLCENNLYSVHSKLDVRQPAGRPIEAIAAAHGMEGVRGDGNDADAVWRIAGRAVAKARAGGGPTLVVLDTYRWREHVGPMEDWNLGYRDRAELALWQARCPVRGYAERLRGAGVLSVAAEAALEREVADEIGRAVKAAQESPFPPADHLTRHVYPG